MQTQSSLCGGGDVGGGGGGGGVVNSDKAVAHPPYECRRANANSVISVATRREQVRETNKHASEREREITCVISNHMNARDLQRVYREYTKSIQRVYREYTESIQRVYREYTESIQREYREYTESIQRDKEKEREREITCLISNHMKTHQLPVAKEAATAAT
jgi:hypothetical protein